MRAWRAWMLGAVGAWAGVAALVSACGKSSSGTCSDTDTCAALADGSTDGTTPGDGSGNGGDAGDGGTGEGGGDGSDGGGCDGTQDPSTAPCVISEQFGVFVSPTGSDTSGTGMRAMPFATVTHGLSAAKQAGKRVYVCEGTYPEQVTIDATVDGVNVYGAFSCADWSYATTNVVTVAPTVTGPALTVTGLTVGTTVEDMAFVSESAQTAGDSSVAVFATGAQNVVFRRVAMTSGDGAAGTAGADGASMSNYNVTLSESAPSIAGNNAVGQAGGGTQTCSGLCANGIASTGGKGGGGDVVSPGAGNDGGPTIPPDPTGVTPKHNGAGGAAASGGNGCNSGDPGATAAAPMGGGPATSLGSLTATGWTPTNGQPGTPGGPGQGGGGGGGGIDPSNGGGGGGGCGGCGGSSGAGGKGGGSSFALLSFQSMITLDACTLTAGNGKNGGAGGAGQVGQLGGYGGNAPGQGCKGGAGGTGGAGSGGGGGTGGVSVGIGYNGTAPTQTDGTTTATGTAGQGGAGGGSGVDAGTVGAGQTGLPGVAAATQAF